MARTKVELVLSADDAAAIQATQRLLEKARETGGAMDQHVKQRGTDAFNAIGRSVQMLIGAGGPIALFMNALDMMKQKTDALMEAMERRSQASESYGQAFGKLMMNIPGVSAEDTAKWDATLRNIASRYGMGEGGLTRLTDAAATVQSSMPLAPMGGKFDVLRETAQMLEMEPTADPSGIALGIGKVMEASGWKLSANQAQNLLRMQQTLGLVKEVGQVSQMIPELGAAARMGQVGLPQMMGLAAYTTQATGDVTGEQTTTMLAQMTAQLMTRGADIEKIIGMRPSGNVLERLGQIRDEFQAGNIDETKMGKLFPKISRGGPGKMMLSGLLGEGWDYLQEDIARMTAPSVLEGDLMEQDITTVMRTLPAQEAHRRRRREIGATEAARAADVTAAERQSLLTKFTLRMEEEERPQSYIAGARRNLMLQLDQGAPIDEATAFARGAGMVSQARGLGWVPELESHMERAWKKSTGQPWSGSSLENVETLLTAIRDALQGDRRMQGTPRSALATGADR